jgi:hypothetical protein
VIVALPALAQIEVKLTVCGVAIATPPLETDTLTLTLVVPLAASGGTAPNVGVLNVTVVAPIANPANPVTVAPATCALALIVVAPAAPMLAEEIWIEAVPVASVSAVPPTGVITASEALVAKVTTVLGTTAPAESCSTAFTVTGAVAEIVFTVAPAALTSVRIIVGATTGGVIAAPVVVVPPTPEAALAAAAPGPPPPPQAVRAREAAMQIVSESLVNLLPEKILNI